MHPSRRVTAPAILEIGIVLLNTGTEDFEVKHCDRIAQLIIHPYIAGLFEATKELEASDRGTDGFGSTGA